MTNSIQCVRVRVLNIEPIVTTIEACDSTGIRQCSSSPPFASFPRCQGAMFASASSRACTSSLLVGRSDQENRPVDTVVSLAVATSRWGVEPTRLRSWSPNVSRYDSCCVHVSHVSWARSPSNAIQRSSASHVTTCSASTPGFPWSTMRSAFVRDSTRGTSSGRRRPTSSLT